MTFLQMAFLQTNSGPQAGWRFELTGSTAVMGRHPDCDIIIDVGAVSRHHAQVLRLGNDYYVEDMQSRNGTYLNDQLVRSRQLLHSGDDVRVCDVTFSFHNEPAKAPAEHVTLPPDGSSYAAVLVDDDPQASSSQIMSTLNVSSASGTVQLVASAEAKLGALLEITQSLGKALSLDEVLPQVLNSLFKVFVQADRGFIVLKDQAGRLVPRWTKLRHERADENLRISRTIANQVMESKEAILSADAAKDQRFQMSQSIVDFQIRSMMCAPLIYSDGSAMGVLQIDTLDQRNRYQQEDLEVLASVASQAAIAIDNAQLHENALRQRALERDLELAHEVQHGFLPEHRPQVPGYHFFDFYQSANEVGGDYYDYFELPNGRVAVIVADVVGHGIAAALLMAKLSAQVRFCLASHAQPGAALTRLNATYSRGNVDDRFVTLVMVVLNPANHQVMIANAGHMAPLLRRGEGDVFDAGESETGLPLGVLNDTEYDQCTITLSPGQTLTLYTDGINEAEDEQGLMYGIDRIRQHVGASAAGVEQLGSDLITDVRQFITGGTQNDDMCVVCFGRALS